MPGIKSRLATYKTSALFYLPSPKCSLLQVIHLLIPRGLVTLACVARCVHTANTKHPEVLPHMCLHMPAFMSH